MFCAIRPLDFRSHLKLVLFLGGGLNYFSIPFLNGSAKEGCFLKNLSP